MRELIGKLVRIGSKGDIPALNDALELCRVLEDEGSYTVDADKIFDERSFKDAHDWSKLIRSASASLIKRGIGGEAALELNNRTLLFDALYDFDSYCRFIETNRPIDKRFYEPRRYRLREVAAQLQRLEDDEIDILGISLPPGTGKTTIAIFFLTWIAGKYPDMPSLGGSHSNSFLRGVYDECLRIMQPNGEYRWSEVFGSTGVCRTNAKDMRIDLGFPKRFETLQFSSIGSGNAGKVRAQKLLYCDDLVESIEQAMSKERLDKLWQAYTTDFRQRKIGDCKELHIATRWSIHDVIGRLEEQYADDPRAAFIRFPALNEDDESNFDYGNSAGFSTEFYHEQRDIMDDASWRALYMNEPIERDGQLYSEVELRRYFDLPDREPDAVIGVLDTKNSGSDYYVMPVAYKYGNDYFIEDFICDNGNPDIVEPRIVSKMMSHKMQLCRIESNSAGGRIAESIQNEIKHRNGITKITTKWSQANKETKIIVNSPWVKEHCLFKDESCYRKDKEYSKAMKLLCGYTMAGRNKHDDVPDAMAMLAEYTQNLTDGIVQIVKRTF